MAPAQQVTEQGHLVPCVLDCWPRSAHLRAQCARGSKLVIWVSVALTFSHHCCSDSLLCTKDHGHVAAAVILCRQWPISPSHLCSGHCGRSAGPKELSGGL